MEAQLSGTGSDGNLFPNVADGLVGCPVGGPELGGRDVSDLAVQAPVVVSVDVFGDRDLDVADRRPPP